MVTLGRRSDGTQDPSSSAPSLLSRDHRACRRSWSSVATKPLEHALLARQAAHRSDVGNGKREAVERFIARAQVEAAVLISTRYQVRKFRKRWIDCARSNIARERIAAASSGRRVNQWEQYLLGNPRPESGNHTARIPIANAFRLIRWVPAQTGNPSCRNKWRQATLVTIDEAISLFRTPRLQT